MVADAIGHGELTEPLSTLAESAVDPAVRRQAALWTAARLPADEPRAAGLYSVALAALPRDEMPPPRSPIAGSPPASWRRWPSCWRSAPPRRPAPPPSTIGCGRRPGTSPPVGLRTPRRSTRRRSTARPRSTPGRGAGAIGDLPGRAELFRRTADREDERLDPGWAARPRSPPTAPPSRPPHT
ncbi:MAG: hypothetical protein HS111_37055 [Kofleriaceae bacterium]|nr:hypothetical protein [Kofleriaceae bacterium]